MAEKKGISPLAWVAIGCIGLIVIGGIVVAAGGFFAAKKVKSIAEDIQDDPGLLAEKIIDLNPELEVVSRDKDAGTITVRNVDTGEVATFDWSEVREGRIRFESTDAEGNRSTSTLGDSGDARPPSWFQAYPGAGAVQATFRNETSAGVSGMFSFPTDDSVGDVLDHYDAYFEDAGWETERSTYSAGTAEGGSLSAEHPSGDTVNLVVADSGSGTTVNVTYNDRN